VEWTGYGHAIRCSGQTGRGSVSVGLWGDLLSVLFTVAQWTGYVCVVRCSGQTGRGSRKCWFVGRFTVCTVHCSTVDGVRVCSLV
jgi:hypothetical protein